MKLTTGMIFVGLMLSFAAQGASFDCAKARSTFERFVCGGEVANATLTDSSRLELIELDEALNTVYQEALTKHFDPALFRREQRAWLKARDRCVRDKNGCFILGLYRDRIDALRYDMAHPPKTPEEQANARLLSMGSPPGNNFGFDRDVASNGYGFGLCEALVRWVNHTTPKGEMNEPRRIVRLMPGLSEPAWQELDIQQHIGLFTKLVENKWGREGDKSSRQFIDKQIEAAGAGEYRMWMAKEYLDGKNHRPKTLVIIVPTVSAIPMEEKRLSWPQIVTDDLHDVERQATLNYLMPHGSFLMHYKDRPYVMHVSDTRGFASGVGIRCEISNFKPERSKK